MKRYVTYLADGTLDGCYLQTPPEDHVGRMIVIDEDLASAWVNYRANEARDGIEPLPPAVPDEAAIVAAYESGVQQHLDSTAWLYGYDNLISAITYAEEPAVPAFQVEGQAFRAWRSLAWATCREVLAQYKTGERAAPTLAELFAELPALDLPPPTLGRSVPQL
jgi:hypothetical protein